MGERIQKRIAASGLMSRRAAEDAIAAGRVTINGRVASLGESAEACDRLKIDGRPLPPQEEKRYIMLHKPRGYVTTLSDEKGRRNVSELVSRAGGRLFPVGRLDMDSEGLLLMTNDGDFAQHVMHPSHEVAKTYLVRVRGDRLDDAIRTLSSPLLIDGYRVRAADVKLRQKTEDGGVLAVTIHEGRNRQVRKMCALAGLAVTRLIRISEGGVSLGELKCGCWRDLTREEIEMLQNGAES